MREVSRSGVLIDTCTRCRGVWLDRGELEKLASAVEEPRAAGFFGRSTAPSRDTGRDDDDDYDHRRSRDGERPSRKSSFLDFFD
jgi:hypothetical protein